MRWMALLSAVILIGLVIAYGPRLLAGEWPLIGQDNVIVAQSPTYLPTPIALRPLPRGRKRPVIAVVADNDGTETTDFILPYGLLKDANVGEVIGVSSRDGPVELMPSLRIRADETMARFEERFPDGADIVIVPALHHHDKADVLSFLRRQAVGGALVVAICDGAWTVARAGLFDGRHATGHWFAFYRLAREFPATKWVRDTRFVFDGAVASTTGVAASVPVSLALIEALSDSETARRVARRHGMLEWDSAHDSDDFALSMRDLLTAIGNQLLFWRHETLAIHLSPGFDEMALALQADAWSRTYRSRAITLGEEPEIVSARGLRLLAEQAADHRSVPIAPPANTGRALDDSIDSIAERYGKATASFVALQLEHGWTAAATPGIGAR
jgi:transcriptional regulator GlxA family with amidase domain